MDWLILAIAGLFEMGWPLGFKLATTYPSHRVPYLLLAILAMAASGYFLYVAQKTIPIGTAYCVWTGIGAIGTVLIGIFFFHDSASFLRIFFVTLILIGVIGLKLVK